MSFSQEEKNDKDESNIEKVKVIKLAVLGKSLVGKSALTYRFISDKFPTEHDTTVEDQYKINITVDDINIELEILDTAGQDDYQTMLDTWIGFGNCYLLVYAIDDKESFLQIKNKYNKICSIKKYENEKFSAVIVGNKCDLPESSRKVTKFEAENLGKNFGIHAMEVSALSRINVREAFIQVVHDYLSKTQEGNIRTKAVCPCF